MVDNKLDEDNNIFFFHYQSLVLNCLNLVLMIQLFDLMIEKKYTWQGLIYLPPPHFYQFFKSIIF